MKPPLDRELADREVAERAAIDGRVIVAGAAALLAGLLIALVDRIGAPERLVAALGVLGALAGLSVAGLLLRTMRISRFYAAGRATPAPYVALAAMGLTSAVALRFLPPSGDPYAVGATFAGLGAGLALAGLVVGPLLRRTGAFSLADLLAARFENRALRLALATATALVGAFVALAALETAVSGLGAITGLGRAGAAFTLVFPLAMIGAPGGVSGIVWASAAAGLLALAAHATPLVTFAFQDHPIAAPLIGDSAAFGGALDQIGQWQGAAGGGGLWSGLALALGLATLAPTLAPFVAARDRGAAARAGLGALVWSGVFAFLVAATIATSTLVLIDSTVGRRPERLPGAIYAASATRLVGICGRSVARADEARAACQARGQTVMRPQDIEPRGAFLLTALAPLGGLGAAETGLVWAAHIALAMALAAAGVLSFASALGHDAFYRLRDSAALTSRRLAVTRAIYVAAALAGAAIAGGVEMSTHLMLGLALAVSTAAVAPLLALAFWPRATAHNALAALIAGVATALALGAEGGATLTNFAPNALVACAVALATGLAASFVAPARDAGERARARSFVRELIGGRDEVIVPDKGA